jgi:hypothetical protein
MPTVAAGERAKAASFAMAPAALVTARVFYAGSHRGARNGLSSVVGLS